MTRGIKTAEGFTRPPKEDAERPKNLPELLEAPELDVERINEPGYLADVLDKRAKELRERRKMLDLELENELIGEGKYLEVMAQLDAAEADFAKNLEEAEKKFGPKLPPEELLRPLKKRFLEAQMQYVAKEEAAGRAKLLFRRGEMSQEKHDAILKAALQARAVRGAVREEMPEERQDWASQLIMLGEKDLSGPDTLAPEVISAAAEKGPEKEPGLFNTVQGFDELDELIKTQGKPGKVDEEGNQRVWVSFGDAGYQVEELRAMITDIRDGHISTQRLTRQGGLRDKVEELLGREQQEKAKTATGLEPQKEVPDFDEEFKQPEPEPAPEFEEDFTYNPGDPVWYLNEPGWHVEKVAGKLADISRVVKNAKGQDVLEKKIVDLGDIKPQEPAQVVAPDTLEAGEVELQRPGPAPDVAGEIRIPKPDRDESAAAAEFPLPAAEKQVIKLEAQAEETVARVDRVYDEMRGAYSELASPDLDPARRKELQSQAKELEKERNVLTGRTWGAKFKKFARAGYDKALAGLKAGGAYVGEKFIAGAEYIGGKVLSVAEAIKIKMKKALPKYAERLLTAATFGWWDVHQAEKFRTATKSTAKDVELLAGAIRQEKGLLSEDEAMREAKEMIRLFEASGIAQDGGLTASDYESANLVVSDRKHVENVKKENGIVILAMGQLKNKLEDSSWFMKYRSTRKGELLSPETMSVLEGRLRENLGSMRAVQSTKDVVDYKKLIRESLDPHYWNRYVYGGIALALNSIGLAYNLAPGAAETVASKTAEAAGTSAAASGAGVEAAKQAAEIGLRDTIWQEAQRQLVQQGIASPTDAMIQSVSIEIAKESGVQVVNQGGQLLWQETAGGVTWDIAMQKGFMLKLGGALKQIAVLKAGLAA